MFLRLLKAQVLTGVLIMEDTEISDQIIISFQDFIEVTFCPLVIIIYVCLSNKSNNHNTKQQGMNRPFL